MSNTIKRLTLGIRSALLGVALSGLFAGSSLAEPTVAEDLFAVITLQGKPCGQVTEHKKLAENDYEVVCKSGDRYRVRISAEQVVVEER